jgi:peptide deformylase
VIDVGDGKKTVLINPEITREDGEQEGSEGCLSIPGITELIKRPMKVWVKNRKPNGSWEEVEGEGVAARAICHEIDHLKGRLFVEYLGPVKRGLVRRKYQKQRQE